MSRHFRADSALMTLIISILLVGAVTYIITEWTGSVPGSASATRQEPLTRLAAQPVEPKAAMGASATTMPAASPQAFVASAPGRIEPWGGEVKVGAQVPGRIVEVAVEAGDHVKVGDLLFRVDDEELAARLAGAETEALIRQRERDEEPVRGPALERRQAMDSIAAAERAVFEARLRIDAAMPQGNRTADAKPASVTLARVAELAQARADYKAAEIALIGGQAALAHANSMPGLPQLSRLEASLASSRAEALALRIGLSHTRVRAPIDGTVLRVNAKVGETAAPLIETAQVSVGDVSKFRVTAEVDERDAAKIKPGQIASLVAKSVPDRRLEGHVVSVAEALSASRFGSRIPGRQSDFDVLEITLEVAADAAIKPGMRVDVFFKPATDLKGKTAQSN